MTFEDRDDPRDDEDETTPTPSAPEAAPAVAPETAAVVRLYLRDAGAQTFSGPVGSANVITRTVEGPDYIEVPREDADRWLAAHDELRTEA